MKALFASALLVITAVTVISCSKKGDTGPEGNANVTLFNFGSKTFTSTTDYALPISQGKVDSSLVLAYYNPSLEAESSWYSIPGNGSTNAYVVRNLLFHANPTTYTYRVFLQNPAGGTFTGSVTFRKFRIFVIPASTLINGRSMNAEPVAHINNQSYTAAELKAMPYQQVCSLLGVTP